MEVWKLVLSIISLEKSKSKSSQTCVSPITSNSHQPATDKTQPVQLNPSQKKGKETVRKLRSPFSSLNIAAIRPGGDAGLPGSPRARGIGSREHFVAVDTSWNEKERRWTGCQWEFCEPLDVLGPSVDGQGVCASLGTDASPVLVGVAVASASVARPSPAPSDPVPSSDHVSFPLPN